MGLYDSIYLKFKCPYCGETSRMEFQTKDGECFMKVYELGEVFDAGQFRKIDAIGGCESLTCQLEAAKESVWTNGYYGGFSRSFDVYIYCDKNGRITNKIKIYSLNHHKGTMHGKLGELKKEDNMKVVKYAFYNRKKDKWIDAVTEPMTTDGWLDKFKDDTFDNEKEDYKEILYLYNLEDGEEAFKIWFVFRYKLQRIIEYLKNNLNIKDDEEFASVFLSNKMIDILRLSENENK